ncbi:hypothetical protein ETB97_006401 [Aspergillus alliaceus]|uniref:ATPase inhibitor, mitochondrial n=1 Tax=Petromyces alliaceus TaxID=209559 RepID=A0A8H5ZWK1_PETAA|nr:hypothetical protein ETB97_006401 [Aspergillus burnettii]
MLRQSIRPLTTANRALISRSFSALAPKMAEGDTGAPRPGGSAQAYVDLVLLSRFKPVEEAHVRLLNDDIIVNGLAEQLTNVLASDQFTKREAAQENFYIHEKEREKLLALRRKVQEQRKHLDELDQHI